MNETVLKKLGEKTLVRLVEMYEGGMFRSATLHSYVKLGTNQPVGDLEYLSLRKALKDAYHVDVTFGSLEDALENARRVSLKLPKLVVGIKYDITTCTFRNGEIFSESPEELLRIDDVEKSSPPEEEMKIQDKLTDKS